MLSFKLRQTKKTLSLVSFLISGFLSVPHSDSLPFARHFAPSKGVRYLLLHKWLTTFWVSLRSSKMCSLLSAAHYSRIFARLFVPSKIVRKLASACYSLSLCVASLLQIGSHAIPGSPGRIECQQIKKTLVWVSFLISGFLSVPHSDSLPFARRFRSFKRRSLLAST